jgi:hypothetical protein
MRQKAYYSVNEITTDLYTTGAEWMTADYEEYVGLYHKYTTGEVYTQPKWNKNKSVRLYTYKELSESVKTYNRVTDVELQYNSFETHNVVVTKKDIDAGFITRYIIKKNNEIKFYEIDDKTFTDYGKKKIDPTIYSATQLQWHIVGDIEDMIQGNMTIQGVRSKNLQAVKNAESTMPNLSMYLNNPLQYYTDTDFIAPVDINGLDS